MTAKTSQMMDDILDETLGIHPNPKETPPSAESVLEVVRWLKGCCESAERRLVRLIPPDSVNPPRSSKPAKTWRKWPTYKRLQTCITCQDFNEEFLLDFSKMLYAMSKRMTPTAIREIVDGEFLENHAIPSDTRVEMMRMLEHHNLNMLARDVGMP